MNNPAPFSRRQYEYFQRCIYSWFNVAEGGKRGGKNVLQTLIFCTLLETHKNKSLNSTKMTTGTTKCGKKRAVYAVPPTSDPYYGINWSTGPKHGSAARNTAQKSECERGGNQYVSNQHG